MLNSNKYGLDRLHISDTCGGALASALTADEAGRFQNLFFLLLLAPQIGEGVDDDTKDEVEDDDDDHEEEEQVVYHSGGKQRLLSRNDKGYRI